MISKPTLFILALLAAVALSTDPEEQKVKDSLAKLQAAGIDKQFADAFYNYLITYKKALEEAGSDPAKKKIVDENFDKLRLKLVKQLPMNKLLIVMKWAQSIINP